VHSHNFFNALVKNPLVFNPFSQDAEGNAHPIPPTSEFIVMENDISDHILTEDGNRMVTE
jgi:hypothetical protein